MSAEIVLCCGAGGEGKTTLSAALALGEARAGRRVVAITVDPAKRLADALGVALDGTPSPVPLGEGRLDALVLDAGAVLDRTIRELAADPADAEALLANRYYRAVSRRLAGAPEYMALVELHRLVEDGRWDVVVVDTPPAEDALDLFRAPGRVNRLFGPAMGWLRSGPAAGLVDLVTRATAATLARLIGAAVVDDLQTFFRLVAGMTDGFRLHAQAIETLFASERARTYLVVDARAPDRGGTDAFRAALTAKGPRFAGFLLNRVVPDPGVITVPDVPAPDDLPAERWRDAIGAVVEVARAQAAAAARHRDVAERLRAEAPVWTIPELDGPMDPIDVLCALCAHLPPSPPG